ncbi:MAG: hypothetical protein A2X34_10100 [Elusimicrobia bacterium GWC2_51_8]|nr:MAG: hypothetical protein A2X33_04290 [Elusimicrobia bacterium GWA2_51_34]OGR58187.1 MAG: hypothetical protein A2X34_10100 [Elusimicrobia bacterium GWC2_51_8]OGR84621.1 MAG: hypothetical protein A2021_02495 [Elusimicrobia bacterium GWF2_52_66]HAF95934.1 four helix bundle protein [Elusimicrobiota bacterium]HCE97550.1 four helix bundle protein [Elusimicrobiota bacterium]
MTITRFEDILAWQKARELAIAVYKLSRNGDFAKDFDLRGQIRRAAVSAMSNIAEGYARRSDKEFANFLNIAHGSLGEVQSQLYLATDLDYIGTADFAKLYALADEASRLSAKFAKFLHSTKNNIRVPNSKTPGR